MNQSLPHVAPSEAERQATLRLAEFRQLRERGALCTEATEQLASEAAASFLSHFGNCGGYLADAITLVAEIATLEDPCLAEPGHRATFPLLVEQLSDSFDPQYCSLYDRAFAQMISHCRRLPSGKKLDAALRHFGLASERDLLDRKARLGNRSPVLAASEHQKVRKVLVLSRVTLGADVAITSVVLEKAQRIFPQAERVLLGSPKMCELFGGDSTLRIRDVPYESDGGLVDRLQSWLLVVNAVEQEVRNLCPEKYILMDPDSRLLQLGLLPAMADESRYFFLESRRFGELGDGSLSQITLRWLNSMFGGQDEIRPNVWLQEADQQFGRELCGKLRQGGSRCLIAISFGAGGNPAKRLPGLFEPLLLTRLLEEGSTVLLDKGFGQEELERANRLVEQAKTSGRNVVEINAANAEQVLGAAPPLACHLLTWQGAIGRFSTLVASCDEYIGYDSAGQHIAAALGVPTVDIFTETASPVFRERWRPAGRAVVKVAVGKPAGSSPQNATAILAEVMTLHREIKSRLV